MSYESYKVIHLAAIFVFLSSASVMLLSRPAGRMWKIVTGVASLVILITGMGLVARTLQGGMPPWVIALIVIWVVITALGHMVAKRFPAKGLAAYWVTMVLAFVAAVLAVYKPA